MTMPRRAALWGAVLFIIATATSVAALLILNRAALAADPAAAMAAAAGAVTLAVLLMFASATAIILIPVAFFPVLRRHSEAGALGYFALRVFESVAYVMGGVFTVAMLNLARGGGSSDAFALVADLADIAFAAGPTLFFSLSALWLGILFWRSRLVPRWLAGWKALGALLMVVQGGLTLTGPIAPGLETALFMPIAVNEMVLAVWLIAVGFDKAALARLGL